MKTFLILKMKLTVVIMILDFQIFQQYYLDCDTLNVAYL